MGMDSAADRVTLSLVICTRDRAAKLKRCLRRVGEIKSAVKWELVVVNNGSHDDTAEVIDDFAQLASFPVSQVYEALPGNGRGRNAGLTLAHGDIVAFSDDDCYPSPDYVDRVVDLFRDSRIGFAGGRITLYDPDDFPITIKESKSPQLFPPRSFIPPGEVHGANMMFRRRVLKEIDGFDNAFGAGALFSGDDIDACVKASFAGWWGMYSPEPVVAHHHERKAQHIPALKRRYAIGRGAHLAKFTLNKASARVYAGVWLHRLTHLIPLGPTNCVQELYGAALYLRYWLVSRHGVGNTPPG
jgi:glycosyltransferase involved in cell wall biosynthesis